MIENPIFVVGTPRSGTTLTARILGNNPAIFMPGETHFMEDIYARREELGNPIDENARVRIIERLRTVYARFNQFPDQERVDRLFGASEFAEALHGARSYKDVLSIFVGLQAAAEAKRRWGNQVPRDLFEIDQIFAFYPEAKVIVCVRDPRDFLISYRDNWKRARGLEAERLKRLYHPVVSSLLWKSSMRVMNKQRRRYGTDRIFVSRYEDTVADSTSQARAICAFVGEHFDPVMVDISEHNSSADVAGDGIFVSSVGRWRETLPTVDVFIAQQICRKELISLGYSLTSVRPNPRALMWSILTAPYGAYRALAANVNRRGPLVPYLTKRLGSLVRPYGD